MLKRLSLVLALIFAALPPVHAAGTIPGFSLAQQQDSDGTPLVGCKLYLIQAGTTSTPQNGYQDSDLTIELPNPVICDAYGRLPQIFLADGSIKLRLTKASGVQVFAQDGILVVGASSGGGGGSPVDATTIFQTGDVMWLDVDGTRSGWVRDNGRTIGSATSGATERANADTQALYEFLWNTYSNTICPVSGGRGANAAADWAANKAIATPNKQGLVAGGSDGMGASASSVWASVPVVSGSVTTAGSVVGALTATLAATNLPSHTHSGTTSGVNANHTHSLSAWSTLYTVIFGDSGNQKQGLSPLSTGQIASNSTTTTVESPDHAHAFTTDGGSGLNATPFYLPQKTVLGTWYRKL